MHESILNFSRQRYLWVSVVLCLASITAYIWHTPINVPNGGTWLGYTLGTIAALLIVWLMLFGMRKRSYRNRMGTLRGWLSAHVYLGTSLILITLLHSGFQFGWNLHTLTFVLMLVVIFSGFFGVYAYLRYPLLMTGNRDSAARAQMLDEVAEIDQNCLLLADTISPEIHAIVLRSIEETRLGGGVWQQLRARDGSGGASGEAQRMIERVRRDGNAGSAGTSAMGVMVDTLVETEDSKKSDALRKLIDLLARKRALASRLARDIQLQAMMEIWLYIHVPISFALLAALIGHIVSVFFYW